MSLFFPRSTLLQLPPVRKRQKLTHSPAVTAVGRTAGGQSYTWEILVGNTFRDFISPVPPTVKGQCLKVVPIPWVGRQGGPFFGHPGGSCAGAPHPRLTSPFGGSFPLDTVKRSPRGEAGAAQGPASLADGEPGLSAGRVAKSRSSSRERLGRSLPGYLQGRRWHR